MGQHCKHGSHCWKTANIVNEKLCCYTGWASYKKILFTHICYVSFFVLFGCLCFCEILGWLRLGALFGIVWVELCVVWVCRGLSVDLGLFLCLFVFSHYILCKCVVFGVFLFVVVCFLFFPFYACSFMFCFRLVWLYWLWLLVCLLFGGVFPLCFV